MLGMIPFEMVWNSKIIDKYFVPIEYKNNCAFDVISYKVNNL